MADGFRSDIRRRRRTSGLLGLEGFDRRFGGERRVVLERRDIKSAWEHPADRNLRLPGDRRSGDDRRR
jgi:hypothetical protein